MIDLDEKRLMRQNHKNIETGLLTDWLKKRALLQKINFNVK